MNRIALLSITLALSLAACSKKAEPTTPTGGGASVAGTPFSKTMADAPTHDIGHALEIMAPCNEAGYFKLNVPAGTAFSLDVKVSAGSAMIDVTDANGKSAGVSTEVTADAPKTVTSAGQEGATFVTVNETGACAGNTVSIASK